MRNILLILSIIFYSLFLSCSKDKDIEKWVPITELRDTTKWDSGYSNGGTLPTLSGNNNNLVGTTWVLTRIQIGLSITNKKDTIRFIDNTHYKINSFVNVLTYAYYNSSNNMTLTFNNFMPVNGYNATGILGPTFVDYGQIVGVEFTNLYDTNTKFKMWLTKI